MRTFVFYMSVLLLVILVSCGHQSKKESNTRAYIHLAGEELKEPLALHFLEDEYHLFYNHTEAGTIETGHLKSKDLLHWEILSPLTKFKKENTKSVCIICDRNNTIELGNENEALVAFSIHSSDDPILSVSYSKDLGNSWEELMNHIDLGNPIENVNDIKVIWHGDTERWLMFLLKDYRIEYYSSSDLSNWEFVNEFDTEAAVKKGEWLGIQFFPLDIKETMEIKWCLCISSDTGLPNGGVGTQYFVGDFDGFHFQTDDDIKWLDSGTDFFMPVILSDYLLLNKKPVWVGSINNGQENDVELISFPRTISLFSKYNEYFICSTPIEQINQLKDETKLLAGEEFKGILNITQKLELPLEINLTFDLNNRKYLDFAEVFGIILENENKDNLIIGYHNLKRYFFMSFQKEGKAENAIIDYAPCIIDTPEVDLKLIIDKSTVELFAKDGFVSMTKLYNSKTSLNQIKLFTEGGKISFKEGTIYQLANINKNT